MKKIAWWLVVSVVMQGSAFAQGQGESRLTGSEPQQECEFKTVPVSAIEWQGMTHQQRLVACAQARAVYQAAYPPRRSSEPFSRNLGIAGGVVALVGLIMVAPQGDDVRVVNDSYCVHSGEHYVDVDAGPCQSPSVRYGLYFLGAGGVMAMIGFHHVMVSPMIGTQVKGVKTTIRWGGKR